MEENKKVRVAITQGDTNGIGYELIFKTFAEPEMLELCTPIIYGSPKAAAYHRKALEIPANFSIINNVDEIKDDRVNLLAAYDEETKIDFGMATPESGEAALKALDRAMADYRDGGFDALVTAPINPANIQGEGFTFKGHTNYIETSMGDGKKAMPILVHENIRIAFMTSGIALKDVASAITKEGIEDKLRLFCKTLRRDFNISNPRFAVLALNPSTGERGIFGKEEQDIIAPAIDTVVEEGIQAFGPYPADEFFGNGYYEEFDGIIAMYHDQGMVPFKAIAPDYGVVYSAGLDIIRTEANIGVDYEDAGKNYHDPDSFRHAIYLAVDAYRNRTIDVEASANPLQKLYHEKRDESEKVRFAIPKKHSGAPFPKRNDRQNNEHQNNHSGEQNNTGHEAGNVAQS